MWPKRKSGLRSVSAGNSLVVAQAAQHVDHAVHRAGRVTVRAAQVGQRVIGAIQIAGTVDEKEGIVHCGIRIESVRHYRRIGSDEMALNGLENGAENTGNWDNMGTRSTLFIGFAQMVGSVC